MIKIRTERKNTIILLAILLIGTIVRIYHLGQVPGGIYQDEAMPAYEAWSILHFGTDMHGYVNPVYFTAWGDGQSVLQAYLMIPALAVFGIKPFAIRLPIAGLGILSILCLYLFIKECYDEKIALWCAAFLAVMPWHIANSRWALDCNLAGAFLIFATYAFTYAVKNQKPWVYIVSAICFGLVLYCYVLTWVLVPFLVLFSLIYGLQTKSIKISWQLIVAGIILFIMAMPLLLFLLVNYGFIGEISTGIISIPKMRLRSSEFVFSNLGLNAKTLKELLVEQTCYTPWENLGQYGFYYKWSLLLAVIGLIYSIKETLDSIKKKNFNGLILVNIQFILCLLLACTTRVDSHKLNMVFIPLSIYASLGMIEFIRLFEKEYKWTKYLVMTVLGISFLAFEVFYFGEYADSLNDYYNQGIFEAVRFANNQDEESTIYVAGNISYAQYVLLAEVPTNELKAPTLDSYYPEVKGVQFDKMPEGEKGIYILRTEDSYGLEEEGYMLTNFRKVTVAIK